MRLPGSSRRAPSPGRLFFFKQKTAYEMPNDWSSDVCSSDLLESFSRSDPARLSLLLFGSTPAERQAKSSSPHWAPPPTPATPRARFFWRPANYGRQEIGRASCRERVETSRGGGAVKK